MGELVDEAKKMPRDLTHPYVYVEYWPQHWPHGHIVTGASMEEGESWGEYIEDIANELGEAVLRCNELRHDGHGVTHDRQDADLAFKAAVEQLTNRDYYDEYLDICRKIEHYQLWGDQPAELVFQPDFTSNDINDWLLAVKHPESGMPHFYKIKQSLLELPPPDPRKYRQGKWGWYGKDHNPAPRGR